MGRRDIRGRGSGGRRRRVDDGRIGTRNINHAHWRSGRRRSSDHGRRRIEGRPDPPTDEQARNHPQHNCSPTDAPLLLVLAAAAITVVVVDDLGLGLGLGRLAAVDRILRLGHDDPPMEYRTQRLFVPATLDVRTASNALNSFRT